MFPSPYENAYSNEGEPFEKVYHVFYATELESSLPVSFFNDINFAKERNMLEDVVDKDPDHTLIDDELDDETHFHFGT